MKASLSFFFSLFLVTITFANNLDEARKLINQKQYDSAIVLNNLIISSSNNHFEIAEAHFSSAYCYKKLHNPVSAVEAYLQSLEYYKRNSYKSDVYNNLGNLFADAQLYLKATALFDKAIELEKDSSYVGRAQ